VTFANAGQRYWAHSNHLFSVAALTDAAGNVTERYKYDAYGKQTITLAVGAVRTKSSVEFNRGFTGYVADSETGLAYARNRMYGPSLGRFVSRDPEGYVDGYSPYGAYFVPGLLDPLGTSILCAAIDKVCKAGAAAGGAFSFSTPPVPFLGGASVIVNGSAQKQGDCCSFTVGAGASWDVKDKLLKILGDIPAVGKYAKKKLGAYNLSAAVILSGSGSSCCGCCDICELAISGSLDIGKTPKSGSTPPGKFKGNEPMGYGLEGPYYNEKGGLEIAAGLSVALTGKWNICKGTASVDLSATGWVGASYNTKNTIWSWFGAGDFSVAWQEDISIPPVNIWSGAAPKLSEPCTKP